uniref:Uncharacterized protein n=1 Tax=Anopheles coluzzii TaxID=1518534 RepID=A0A8W7PR06_ANOCL
MHRTRSGDEGVANGRAVSCDWLRWKSSSSLAYSPKATRTKDTPDILHGLPEPLPGTGISEEHGWARKLYKMPACVITSAVLDSSRSFCLVALGPGRNSVGPNTIARLSRRYDLRIPVTEWMSTSFSSCSASYAFVSNDFFSLATSDADPDTR